MEKNKGKTAKVHSDSIAGDLNKVKSISSSNINVAESKKSDFVVPDSRKSDDNDSASKQPIDPVKESTKTFTIDEMAVFCKKKGFVYPTAEIYGGISGFFDLGHLGVELNNNIKQQWWKFHVHDRDDIVGIDGSIITHPKVWKASGHVDSFTDSILICKKCKAEFRGDHLLEEKLKIQAEGLVSLDIDKLIKENNIKCPKCSGDLENAKQFNLMFTTSIGPSKQFEAYLRPETAQLIFSNFRLVADNARLKLPFGIAQIGKSFRNEISPRDFLFRVREFEQMEIEYFVHPDRYDYCPYLEEVMDHQIFVYTSGMQEKNQAAEKIAIKKALDSGLIKTKWHAYWLALEHRWFIGLGASADNFRIRQHLPKEKSHYALDTWDLEYNFPFGWKELEGIANRTDFDLKQHMQFSKTDLSLFDEETKKKVVPHVIAEPSLGLGRAFLVFMFDALEYDKDRGNYVLKLDSKLAPIKLGIFPLVNKLDNEAKDLFISLKKEFICTFDRSGSIGRRYARADEIGIPFCITVDFDTEKDKSVTIRDRNTTLQIRVKISDLKLILTRLFKGEQFKV